jgi:hypothetical protein
MKGGEAVAARQLRMVLRQYLLALALVVNRGTHPVAKHADFAR